VPAEKKITGRVRTVVPLLLKRGERKRKEQAHEKGLADQEFRTESRRRENLKDPQKEKKKKKKNQKVRRAQSI